MRIEQLYYLVELSKNKSINHFAERKFISPQSIGKSIRQLEAEFGIQLLDRSNKGISLTTTGKAFVKAAEVVLEKVEELNQFKCQGIKENTSLSGSLSISTYTGFNLYMVTDVSTHFCKKHPAVKVQINEQCKEEIINNVEAGKSDFGLVVRIQNDEDTCYNQDNIVFEKIYEDKLLFVVGKTHPLAGKKSLSIKTAIKYPLVLFEPGDYLSNLFHTYGEPNIYHTTNSLEVLKKFISEGLAVSYCVGSMLSSPLAPIKDSENYVVIPVREKLRVVNGLLYSTKHPLSLAAQEFISMLKFYYM